MRRPRQQSLGSRSTSTASSALSSLSAALPLVSGDAAALAQRRVQVQIAARRRARHEERRLKALLGRRFDGVNIEAFQRITQARAGRKASAEEEALVTAGERRAAPEEEEREELQRSSFESPGKVLASCVQRQRRRRIAVVGAGPVGLWIATLIALRHARRVRRSAAGGGAAAAKAALGHGFIRGPDAPEVVVFERRAPSEHCSRRNVRITLDAHTVALLNKHTKSRRFMSGMALAEIETILLDQWRRLGGPKALEYGKQVNSPSDLADEDWDLVLWAGGRNSLDDASRQELGCGMRVGESEEVLVFEMRDFGPTRSGPLRVEDLEQLAAADLTFCARHGAGVAETADAPRSSTSAASGSYRIVLRCAEDADKAQPLGWLWFMGLPAELKAAKEARGPPGRADASQQHAGLSAALDAELKRLGLQVGVDEVEPWVVRLRAAAAALQERVLRPGAVTARWVDASYWSSDRVTCSLPPGPSGRSAPLLLVGDVAMGKPFYTGTTLNVHLAEVKALSTLPVIRWGQGSLAELPGSRPGGERSRCNRYLLDEDKAALAPFLAYEERYKTVLARTPGFLRR
ncbi:unnamed protein product [Polarella glacialis]|uniref:Uncharacterized protein n=1 Tax=Polarella glacialis TaxID=89957 RepID=A0A813FWE0_POLGL|nr:unnamed protein product [Polarella glacialis]